MADPARYIKVGVLARAGLLLPEGLLQLIAGLIQVSHIALQTSLGIANGTIVHSRANLFQTKLQHKISLQ